MFGTARYCSFSHISTPLLKNWYPREMFSLSSSCEQNFNKFIWQEKTFYEIQRSAASYREKRRQGLRFHWFSSGLVWGPLLLSIYISNLYENHLSFVCWRCPHLLWDFQIFVDIFQYCVVLFADTQIKPKTCYSTILIKETNRARPKL